MYLLSSKNIIYSMACINYYFLIRGIFIFNDLIHICTVMFRELFYKKKSSVSCLRKYNNNII